MSNENSAPEGVEVEETAKDPQFTSEEKAEKMPPKGDKLHQVTDKAHAQLNALEDQFVSLSSQRQLNFILGTLVLLAAFTGDFGMLISLILGTLMIVQAATGNMIMNDFFDKMDHKHKRWLIPGLIGLIVFILLAYIIIGLTGGES